MAFAISYKGNTAQDISDRSAVTRLIKSHGGRLLDGFNDLFTDGPTSILTTPSTASKLPLLSKPLIKHKHIGELALAPGAQDLGFVAFIGDHYTRKSKFVQALALGLPCLSGRWVTTCVARGRIVPFLPFLLAAGESSYLGGAVRSRLLAPYDPSTARFEETFARREKLLGGKRVIFLMGRGKAEERKRAYLFLTRALGAGEVRRVASVKEAREVIDGGGGWDLVYVDDDKKVAGAEAEILGGAEVAAKAKGKAKGKSGKRKRSDEAEDEKTVSEQGGERKKVRVVGDEFVVQSLILGCLMDED
jgi:DNA repair protein RAD9